ncbi:hypothetical protein [Saccharopolyspora phatthalungensis]|uniref:Uncharacterized protein n=1 Tax=Saccharopolyspora phatthalungensis TaxID=664693 RepID=A0A840Q6P6_9PSEU|nr:hypothetical protein [Saccharopolyspora phatthalungensis]MBB5155560.1 hypothetical protein [Saccharopolyspora phatthalungensis]
MNEELETLSIAEAAAECGMDVDEFLTTMTLVGKMNPVGEDGYEPVGSGWVRVENPKECRTLINRPCWVQAWIDHNGLTVKRSGLVPEDDPVLAPVREFLADNRTELVSSEETEDDRWMWSLITTVYRVL